MIREGCISLVGISDRIVCEFLDPLVLQPASLDVATVKKKPEEDVVLVGAHSVSNSFDGIDLWLQVSLSLNTFFRVSCTEILIFQIVGDAYPDIV